MKSISKSLGISQFVIGVAAITLFSIGLYFYVQRVLIHEVDTAMLAKAKLISQLVELEDDGVDMEFDEHQLDEFDQPDATSAYYIYQRESETSSDSFLLKASRKATPQSMVELGVEGEKVISGNMKTAEGELQRFIQYSFHPRIEKKHRDKEDEAKAVLLTLVITRDQAHITKSLNSLLVGCLICGSGFILLNTFLQWWNIRKNMEPLRTIENEVAKLDASSLDHRLDSQKFPKELQSVSQKMNECIARLEASFVRERSFSASAAHELRTPLTELKAIAQVGLGWVPGDPEDPSPAPYFKDAESVITRMQSLISTLLALVGNRLHELQLTMVEVDVVAITRNVISSSRDEHPSCQMELTSPDVVRMLTDQALLRGCLENLIQNAAEYADRGSLITCDIELDGGFASIRVTNDCRELTSEDFERMTDTFWRKDGSRTGQFHHGLGLSLVQVYADALDIDFTISQLGNQQIQCSLSRVPTPL